MKRALGAMAANWLRKPQNQEKLKRGARQVWSRVQRYRQSGARAGTRQADANAAGRTSTTRTTKPPHDGDV